MERLHALFLLYRDEGRTLKSCHIVRNTQQDIEIYLLAPQEVDIFGV